MNYNRFSKPLNQNNMLINSRAKLDTGTQCNYKCSFCYYINDLDKVTNIDIIKGSIDNIYDNGIKEIDLSGGESSIHKDWFEILDYCDSKFENISCLSNGSMFKNFDFIEKSKKHGLKEILFSLHGANAEKHDKIVNHKNAFKNIILL